MAEPSPVPAAPAAPRLLWVDAARGLSVLLVVLFHILFWHLSQYRGDMWGPADRVWTKIDSILGSVRQPLLLGVSGLVVSRRIKAGLGDRNNLVRAASNYYLYVVWLIVYAVFFAFVTAPDLPHHFTGFGAFALQLISPNTTLWYVYALALYTLVLASVRRVPAWIQLLVLALICVAARSVEVDARQTLKIAENAIFFGVGVHAAPQLRRLAERANLPLVAGTAVLAALTTLSGRFLSGDVFGSVLFMTRGLAFLLFAVALVAVVSRWRPAGALMAGVGGQTLPIYVLHPLLICSVMAATSPQGWLSTALARPAVAVLYPVALLVVIVGICLAVHRIVLALHGRLLFEMPGTWRRRILRPTSLQSSRDQH